MTDSPESRNFAVPVLTAQTSFAAFVQAGVEKVADFQKIALDFYAHQTAGVIDSWKKMALPGVPFPGALMIEAAEKGIADVIAMQKGLLDFVVNQTAQGMAVLRPELPAAEQEPPNKDSIDVFIPERQEEEAAIATKMVDQIVADLNANADKPVVQHVAMQQKPKVKRASAAEK